METEKERLIRVFNAKSLLEDDRRWLSDYLNDSDLSELKAISLEQYYAGDHSDNTIDYNKSQQVLNKIHSIGFSKKDKPYGMLLKIAALLLIILSFSLYFFIHDEQGFNQISHQDTTDIQPGENKAMLTMGDGSQIVLNKANSKLLINKGNIAISQGKDGEVIYNVRQSPASQNAKIEYNVISTPKAGRYRVTLSDGTSVWLNSNSSIRFPTIFSGKERKVEISGEVYFEVAKNRKVPFRVVSANQIVEVLGTHFNVNAYADESYVKTTLLEGSVKVYKGAESVLLKPGQQSQTAKSISIINSADLEAETSWKNGMFYFKDADIATVMRQAGRWYDLEVAYEGKMPLKQFNGKVPNNIALSKFLEILDFSGIKFKIDGRRITIIK
ncbi:FecR domain-containing protein [Pedobacter sp. P351]|uniref:FecR family protein n=1 Tax=Pedobacter superstes TaxID=3133441 RepID=UPI0030A3982B